MEGLTKHQLYYRDHRDKWKSNIMKWQKNNKEKVAVSQKNYYNNNPEFRERKKQKMREYAKRKREEKKQILTSSPSFSS